MISLYTHRKFIKQPVITQVDAYFNTSITSKDLDNVDWDFIYKLEKGIHIDKNLDLLKLPTGLKTLLVIRYCLKNNDIRAINITGCGPDILDLVFDTVDNTNFKLILRHTRFLELRDRTFTINNNIEVFTMKELYKIYLELFQ